MFAKIVRDWGGQSHIKVTSSENVLIRLPDGSEVITKEYDFYAQTMQIMGYIQGTLKVETVAETIELQNTQIAVTSDNVATIKGYNYAEGDFVEYNGIKFYRIFDKKVTYLNRSDKDQAFAYVVAIDFSKIQALDNYKKYVIRYSLPGTGAEKDFYLPIIVDKDYSKKAYFLIACELHPNEAISVEIDDNAVLYFPAAPAETGVVGVGSLILDETGRYPFGYKYYELNVTIRHVNPDEIEEFKS